MSVFNIGASCLLQTHFLGIIKGHIEPYKSIHRQPLYAPLYKRLYAKFQQLI